MSQEGLRGHPTGSSNHISRFDPVMIPSDGTAEGTSNAPPANPTHHLQAQFPDLPTSVNVQLPVGYPLTKWQLGGLYFSRRCQCSPSSRVKAYFIVLWVPSSHVKLWLIVTTLTRPELAVPGFDHISTTCFNRTMSDGRVQYLIHLII